MRQSRRQLGLQRHRHRQPRAHRPCAGGRLHRKTLLDSATPVDPPLVNTDRRTQRARHRASDLSPRARGRHDPVGQWLGGRAKANSHRPHHHLRIVARDDRTVGGKDPTQPLRGILDDVGACRVAGRPRGIARRLDGRVERRAQPAAIQFGSSGVALHRRHAVGLADHPRRRRHDRPRREDDTDDTHDTDDQPAHRGDIGEHGGEYHRPCGRFQVRGGGFRRT